MNTNINWKSLGWLITRKLVYYTIVVIAAVVLFTLAGAALTMKSTLAAIAGALLIALTLGGLITLGIREALFYFKKINPNTLSDL